MPHAAALAAAAAGPRVRLAYVSVLLREHATGCARLRGAPAPRAADGRQLRLPARAAAARPLPLRSLRRNIVDGADHVVFVGSPGYPLDLAQAVNDDGIQVLIYLDSPRTHPPAAVPPTGGSVHPQRGLRPDRPLPRPRPSLLHLLRRRPLRGWRTAPDRRTPAGPSGADGYLSHFVGDPLVSTPEMQAGPRAGSEAALPG